MVVVDIVAKLHGWTPCLRHSSQIASKVINSSGRAGESQVAIAAMYSLLWALQYGNCPGLVS